MRMKLKYALPLVQMALALALLVWSQLWSRAMMRTQDMPGPSPAFTLLVSLNAPVALPRTFWFRYLPDRWDDVTFIVAIGLLWYWVALNVQSWRQQRMAYTFSRTPLRLTCDFVLISVGIFWGFTSWSETVSRYLPIAWSGWLWFVLRMGLQLTWCVMLILFFGRDFIHCILAKKVLSASVSED